LLENLSGGSKPAENREAKRLVPTLADSLRWFIEGSVMLLPEAALVAWIKSPKAEATSLTALISITCTTQGKNKHHEAQKNIFVDGISN
jgi:hypothetical protein